MAKRMRRKEITEVLDHELVLRGAVPESTVSPYGQTITFTEIPDLERHIEHLRKILSNVKKAGYFKASVEVSCDYEDDVAVSVTGTRLENDEEFRARKISEKKMERYRQRQAELRAERKKQKERDEYKRLKAKAKKEGWDA